MRKETFLDLLSDIDDDLIEEAEKVQKKKSKNIMKYLSTAACICIILGGSLIGSLAKYSEENRVKTLPIDTTKKVAEAKEKNALYEDDYRIDVTEKRSLQSEKSKKNQDTEDKAKEEKRQLSQSKKSDNSRVYDGEGTGEFIYNKKLYHIVNSTEYLMANSLPVQVGASDVGANLANNVYDTANNHIGNVYEYKKVNNQGMLIVEDMSGIYNLAVEK